MTRRKTQSEWNKQVYELVGDEYTFTENYISSKEKIKVIHNKCGYEFKITPQRFMRKQSCKMCVAKGVGERNTHSIESFKEKIKAVHGDVYEVVGNYKNMNTKVKVKHLVCNTIYSVRPDSLTRGSGCKRCANEKLSIDNRKTTKEFYDEVRKVTKGNYELVSEYVDVYTKVKIKHIKCNATYPVTPFQFIRGRRCPNCNNSVGEELVELVLNDSNITYSKKKEFDDLVDINKLSYDFFIPKDRILIEYQGVQHYKPVDLFGGESQFITQQRHDRMKREYAEENNYMLIEIPYTENSYDKVKKILSEIL